MIKITLKDGSIKEVEEGKSVFDVAKEISEGLARVATCAVVDGKVVDLRHILNLQLFHLLLRMLQHEPILHLFLLLHQIRFFLLLLL